MVPGITTLVIGLLALVLSAGCAPIVTPGFATSTSASTSAPPAGSASAAPAASTSAPPAGSASASPPSGPGGPAARETHLSRAVQIANRTHEYPSPPAPPEHAPGSPTPQAALLAFAGAYVNWNAGSVAGDLRRLARASIGQARSAMEIQAAGIAADGELRRQGVWNTGTVQAVAPVRGDHAHWVVVTLESTRARRGGAYAGLLPAWHVTVATVTRVAGGWVLSGWQPES